MAWGGTANLRHGRESLQRNPAGCKSEQYLMARGVHARESLTRERGASVRCCGLRDPPLATGGPPAGRTCSPGHRAVAAAILWACLRSYPCYCKVGRVHTGKEKQARSSCCFVQSHLVSEADVKPSQPRNQLFCVALSKLT